MVGSFGQFVSPASALWIAVASAALLGAMACALALDRSQKGFAAATAHFVFIVLAAVLSGSLTWAIVGIAERNALEARAQQLAAQAVAPGSPLACLDRAIGDIVQGACERVLFASPANVAAAVSYVGAQFALLSDMIDYARRGGPDIEDVLVPLRRALEADPFGLLAHVLVMRGGCGSDQCPALAMLHDPSHVRTNMIARTLRHFVDQYRVAWARSSPVAAASMAEAMPEEMKAAGKRKVPVDIDFPTSASIPPISIMNPEPKRPANPASARKDKNSPHDRVDPVWTPAPPQAAK
ncbi:MAG: hypothetical protein WBF58_01410 [Xanthobacteraceae bacterium]